MTLDQLQPPLSEELHPVRQSPTVPERCLAGILESEWWIMSYDQISYRRSFPWLRLVEAIGIALSLRQLLVAAGATGILMLAGAFSGPPIQTVPPLIVSGWTISLPKEPSTSADILTPRRMDQDFLRSWSALLEPVLGILSPRADFQDRLLFGCRGAWRLAVWGLFGLILCRLAARRFTRHEDGSFRKSVQFGVTRWFQAMLAPLLPAAAALLLMIFAVIVALPGRLPLIGETLVLLTTPLIVVFSLAAAYLVIATLLGWPLMVAAIATDDCDGFGGFSRSYSFWTGRSWYFAWCWIVGLIVGTIALSLAHWLALVTLYFSELVISVGVGPSPVSKSAGIAALTIVAFLLRTFSVSLFWSTATVIYILLRQSVDKMPLDHSAPDDDERDQHEPLPVVGMPAMQ